MNVNNSFPFALSPITLTAVVVIALLLVFSVSSIIVAWRGSEQPAMPNNTTVVPDRQAPAPVVAAPIVSAPEAAAPEGSQTSPAKPDSREDFETIWQREEAQRETIRTLRKEARDNPDAENTPTEEEIRKMEKSGALLL
ncbi:MAG: hypothetical protein HYV36_05810 [Lentisphaerae bacterium]|nr:hypothetical protein [Lentisphaerota bacterium]